ncbi:phospho-N-acetylmuramoyl-pentapeptide-transferase [Herpetosiphon gulosus]|uniref:Phospho-N-acetylmuramoyl-pentapeptide-transferase n=1 Tax=Herpetosiphon gulosus TaxID=1973496 RepID=A0ABP9WTS3_9CHLR
MNNEQVVIEIQRALVLKLAEALLLAGAAFVLTLVLGRWWIRWLKAHNIGKAIRVDGPQSHMIKIGTPTMGGVMIIASVVIITVIFNLVGRWSMLLPLAALVGYGILGAFDDYLSLTKVRSKTFGLTERFKMVWLVMIAFFASLALYLPEPFGLDNGGEVVVPFVGVIDIGYWYIPIATFLIVAMANAVNFSDGMDGLAGWTSAIAFAAFGVIAFVYRFDYLVTYSFTVSGACVAFLWFNAHPAQVFMGDTGSLALGATLAIVALISKAWLLLPIVGIIYVLEAASVVIQRYYFKYTRITTGTGKRVFKMTPIHHHFELAGWSEMQVVQRFVMIGIIAAMIGISLALNPALPQQASSNQPTAPNNPFTTTDDPLPTAYPTPLGN